MHGVIYGLWFLTLVLSACSKQVEVVPRAWDDPGLIDLHRPWEVASPASQHLVDDAVTEVMERGAKVQGLQSIVIVKNGKLIGEKYYQGTAEDLRHMRSCTKTIVSLLAGIAIEQKQLESVDQPIFPDLSPVQVQAKDTFFQSIRLKHLLTMTGGFHWDESDFTRWIDAPNQFIDILGHDLDHPPGTYFNYCSPSSHLLGAIISKAAGATLDSYAQTQLFDYLGIEHSSWLQDHEGYQFGAFGLQLTTRDMAKIGYLLIQQGNNGINQVVPATYIDRCVKNILTKPQLLGPLQLGFGYSIWTTTSIHHTGYLLWGYGGQFIYCVPSEYLVIASSAAYDLDQSDATKQETSIMHYIVDAVHKSIY